MEVPFGFCHCTCGEKTNLAVATRAKTQEIKGQPLRYIHGHHAFKERAVVVQPQDPSYRIIALTQGQVATVDHHLYDWIMEDRWHARWSPSTKSFYAMRRSPEGKSIQMHRQILGLDFGDEREGDHQDHNTLDNRGRNLRLATCAQNSANKKVYRNNRSGYKGIGWHENKKKWRARIRVEGKLIHLGYFDTREEASEAYRLAAIKYYGKFACAA